MKISKLKILGLIGFLGAIGGILLKKLLIVLLVGLLGLQSALASLPSSAPINDNLPKAISQLPESSLMTQIPRIRNAPVELGDALPGDFLATRQMPLSSGRREVLLVSASTGTEQRYLINMPGNSDFQLHQVDFKNVSGFDPSRIIRGETQPASAEVHTALRTFNLTFQNGNPETLTLADGSQAQFRGNQLIIRSPAGEEIEAFQASALSADEPITLAKHHHSLSQEQFGNINLENSTKTSHSLLAQSNPDCQTQVVRSLARISTSITHYTDSMANSQSSITQMARWALSYSAKALENSTLPEQENIQDISCRPPVQCDQQQISGGSEIRTDLFALAPGASHGELILEYEFYTIPDTLEMYYNGQRIFSTGEVSGQNRRSFSIPASAQEIGITIIGNRNTNTRWWYKISCSQLATAPPNQQDTSQESGAEKDCQEITSEVARLSRSLEALDRAKENYESLQARLAIENYDLARIANSLENTATQLDDANRELQLLHKNIPGNDYQTWLEENQRLQSLDWTSDPSARERFNSLVGRVCDQIPDKSDIIPLLGSALESIGDIAPGYTDNPLLEFGIEQGIAQVVSNSRAGQLLGQVFRRNPYVWIGLKLQEVVSLTCLADQLDRSSLSPAQNRMYENYQLRKDTIRDEIRYHTENLLATNNSINSMRQERQSTAEEIFRILNRELYGNTDAHINSILESGQAPNPDRMLDILRELDNWRQEMISRLNELKNSPCLSGA